MKKVSVIVPCYNAARWLPKCFVSLAGQTMGMDAMELIFIDDASNDGGQTWNMLQEFERAFPESVLIIQLKENMRQGGARNTALQYATGQYLAFVDADDFVTEDFLEKVYNRAVKENADVIQFSFAYYTDKTGAVFSDQMQKDDIIFIQTVEDRKKLLISEKITYGCWNKLYRTELVTKTGIRFAEHVMYEEPLFVYPLLFYADRFVIVKEVFYYYRQNEAGTMRKDLQAKNTLRMHSDVQLQVWNFMKKTEFFQTYYEEIKLYFLHTYFYEAFYFAKQRGFKMSAEFYRELLETVQKEVPDYRESEYEYLIPQQMKLYQAAQNTMAGGNEIEAVFVDI